MAGGARSAVTISKAQRTKQFMSLRTQGLSIRAIADAWLMQTGNKISKSTVQNDIAAELRTLAEQTRGEAEYYRELELARLDMAMSAIAKKVSQGHIAAVGQWIRISESRCKLLGLNEPVQLRIQQGLESELNSLLEFLEGSVSREAYAEFMAAVSVLQDHSAAAHTN